jgi:hypothetical protein
MICMPIGFHFIDSASNELLKGLIDIAIEKIHTIAFSIQKDVAIKWLVFDGLSPMRAFKTLYADKEHRTRYRDIVTSTC